MRLGSGLSAGDRINGGAIFSALGASYLGGLCSIRGAVSFGSTSSLRNQTLFGSIVSVRASGYMGSIASVFDKTWCEHHVGKGGQVPRVHRLCHGCGLRRWCTVCARNGTRIRWCICHGTR